MKIKIIRRPIGEAPEWVRDAWIGLSLPLTVDRQGSWWGLGVLSGPHNSLLQLWALASGKCTTLTGYSVIAKTAVDLLEEVQPKAAAWWRVNAPRLLDGKRRFVFDANACEREQQD